jgi:hypothetical protein
MPEHLQFRQEVADVDHSDWLWVASDSDLFASLAYEHFDKLSKYLVNVREDWIAGIKVLERGRTMACAMSEDAAGCDGTEDGGVCGGFALKLAIFKLNERAAAHGHASYHYASVTNVGMYHFDAMVSGRAIDFDWQRDSQFTLRRLAFALPTEDPTYVKYAMDVLTRFLPPATAADFELTPSCTAEVFPLTRRYLEMVCGSKALQAVHMVLDDFSASLNAEQMAVYTAYNVQDQLRLRLFAFQPDYYTAMECLVSRQAWLLDRPVGHYELAKTIDRGRQDALFEFGDLVCQLETFAWKTQDHTEDLLGESLWQAFVDEEIRSGRLELTWWQELERHPPPPLCVAAGSDRLVMIRSQKLMVP